MATAMTPSNTNIVSQLRREFIECIRDINNCAAQLRRRDRGGEVNVRDVVNERMQGFMRMVVKAYSCNSVNELLKRVNNHIDEVKRAFIEAGYEELIDSTYVIISRLAVGLRNPYMEVLETGIAWDPYWNLPYIPSSSLKGAVRAAAYSDKSPCLNALGLQAESSAIIILDSYPVICPGNKGLLTLDIVNPHYSEVNGEISEAESSPNPVILPTITKGVGFRIVILVAKNRLRERLSKCGGGHCNYVYLSSDCKNACTRDEFTRLIMSALSRGVGAKTALGYGRFKVK